MTEPEFRDETAGMPVEDNNPDELETTNEVAEFTEGVQSQDPSYQPAEKSADDERQY